MKRNVKQSGSGGRLRLGLLMACAAAFLLVPASQAAATHGEPHLKLNIIAEPGASGEVTSEQSATGSPWEGEPTLACIYPVGGPQEGVCENEMEFQENPFTGEKVEWRGSMRAFPGPESFVEKWEVVTGEIWSLCESSEGEPFDTCSVRTPNESEDIEVNLYLGFEGPEVLVNLIGVEGGGGEVISNGEFGSFPGEPPIECVLPEGGTQEGTCKNEATEIEEGLWGVRLSTVFAEAPNSELEKWEVLSGGKHPIAPCEPEGECFLFSSSASEDMEVNVYLACEEGKECPEAPEPPEVRVNVIGIAGGGGEVVGTFGFGGEPPIECKLPEGAEGPAEQEGVCEAIATEVEEGLWAVRVNDVKAPNSEFVEWEVLSGKKHPIAPCEPTGECFLFSTEASEDLEVNAYFECEEGKECPPTFYPLSISTSGGGSGTVVCKIDGGSEEACPEEVEKGSEVEVIATPDGISTLDALTGGGAAAGTCSSTEAGGTCTFTMTAPSSVSAEFNLKTYPLTLTAIENGGTGSFQCDINGGGLGECPEEVTHGDEVVVVASAGAESEVESTSGTGECGVAEDRQSGTCTFTVSGSSEVTAEFVTEGKIAKDPGNVFGEVELETTLETLNCDNVDLGPFVPSAGEEKYENNECVVTVTATGQKNELRAADETGGLGGTDETGHLTQEPTFGYTLNKALEVQGTGTTGGASPNPSGWLALSGPAIIQDYGTPVSLDTVTVGFRQFIEAFEPLHTGTYSKTITLTLEQTVL